MPEHATDYELAGVVLGTVAMIRRQYPRVDGLHLVLPLAVLVAVAVCFLASPSSARLDILIRAGRVGVGAVATTSAAKYLIAKWRGEPVQRGPVAPKPTPPPPLPSVT